ncbi:sensor histidine kinase [Parasphingorhabdus pacifica]
MGYLVRTLRGRLLLVLLGATVIGLFAMGFTSAALLDRSLTARVDEKLADMARPWEEGRHPPPGPPMSGGDGDGRDLPTDFRVLFFDRAGDPTGAVLGSSETDPGRPVIRQGDVSRGMSTVPDSSGGSDWRVRMVTLPDGGAIALAVSLGSVDSTLRELIVIELVVGAFVVIVLAAVANSTVRLGLRPLTRIEHTANAIASGELDRRVTDQDPGTETGRLGAALNTMLGRLVDALQQSERSENRLRRFVADASHELRTPLTSIRGFAELYRRSENARPDDVRMMMSRIESESVRMGTLVEDLLLLARLDRERTIDLVELDLIPPARDVVHDARIRDPDREISLVVPGGAVRVLGDAARLCQVLTNLVTNALVHTAPGAPVQVVVDFGTASPDCLAATGAEPSAVGRMGVLEVADSGPGIDPEHAPRVFDRFYRVADGRERSAGGTGLGLAITAAITEAHNGRAELVRNFVGGSTFRVLVPLS